MSRYGLHTALCKAPRLHKRWVKGEGVEVGVGSGGGGGGGGGLSHPSVKGAARRASFRVLHQSARHLRTLSPTSLSSHYLKGGCICAVAKYSRASMTATRVAPFNVN